MNSEVVKVAIEGSVATITLNRPEVMNTLDLAMAEALPGAIEASAFRRDVRAVVLTGAGENFMAGGDVKVFAEHLGHGSDDDLVVAMRNFQRSAKLLRRVPKPVVAKVRGACAGGGLSLALACDMILAAESATFSVAYSAIGAPPDGGMTYNLPRAVGMKKAMELVLLSERLGAREALELGLVNRVVADAELDAATEELVARLAAGPTRAYARAKTLLYQAFSRDMSDQLESEAESFLDSFVGSPDFAEGVRAFAQKRRPDFRGR